MKARSSEHRVVCRVVWVSGVHRVVWVSGVQGGVLVVCRVVHRVVSSVSRGDDLGTLT